MNDFMEPQLGLRRRRRAVPDEIGEGGGEVILEEDLDNNNRNDPAEEAPLRMQPPPPPRRVVRRPRRTPLSDTRVNSYSTRTWRLSHTYCFVSTLLALLAILATTPTSRFFEARQPQQPISSLSSSSGSWTSAEQVVKAAAVGVAAKRGGGADAAASDPETRDFLQSIQQWWNAQYSPQPEEATTSHHPWWLRWTHKHRVESSTDTISNTSAAQKLLQWVDPAILHPSMTTPTDIIDKILTSTPRLLSIANFLLAMTYLLHSAVAAWFLGAHRSNSNMGDPYSNNQHNINNPLPMAVVGDWSTSAGARERMGGFLVFKLLLISAVVAPDTLDLLILLTWYTILSCLRSLGHLAHATTTHLAAVGQPPRPGVLHLLILVLVCNILAAASCVALFHAAGWGMVLLLTCDCALLGADVLSHMLKHFQCVLEDSHSQTIQRLEARQLELHTTSHNNNTGENQANQEEGWEEIPNSREDNENGNVDFGANYNDNNRQDEEEEGGDEMTYNNMSSFEVQQESRRLDRQMEVLDLAHARRLSILDSVMFGLELVCHFLTVIHFCHIWSLHGVQFTLLDGVLALHLHSAISTACKKIAQRRNIHSIARDLQGLFPNATDQELRKASLAGDVCCICLGTMSTGGHVKKVHCGHLYHTHCLREVVERAQSIQAAKCPLCRASVLDGRRPGEEQNRNTAVVQQQQQPQPPEPQQQQTQPQPGEHALFRFTTEGIFPAWLPIPAFSFEVVRRPTAGAQPQQQQQQQPVPVVAIPQQQTQEQEEVAVPANNTDNANTNDNPEEMAPVDNGSALDHHHHQPPPPQQQQQTSLLRRILVLAGAIPMSPEEEARALAQLVDMFPQYDRSDLLRELRERGSSEAVAESILLGIFSGVPRGD